jgi:hypothetical protein
MKGLWRDRIVRNRWRLVVITAAVMLIGITVALATRAAGPSLTAEPESGVLSGAVATIADNSASGGQAVQFGASTPPATGGGYLHVNLPLDNLTVIDQSKLNDASLVMMQTLQGILAQTHPRIWIQGSGTSNVFLADLKARDGITTTTANDPWALVSQYKSSLTGYILFDTYADSENVAVSLAGPKHAIAVATADEAKAKAAGLTMAMDVRGKDSRWALATYPTLFSKQIMVEQPVDAANLGFLRDIAAARNAFTFYDGGTSAFRATVAKTILNRDSITFGWGGDCCERQWVQNLSAGGSAGVASNYSRNLSALQAAKEPNLTQKTHSTITKQNGVHYVAFVMSDGDNLQWIENNFGTSASWWGSPSRGKFNMNWEMPPILADFAPSILRYFQNNASNTATGRDFFVGALSGQGYMFPSLYGDTSGYTAKLGQYANATDEHYVTILNDGGGMEACDSFLARPEISGVLYKDFVDYNKQLGAIRWSNGKPCLSYRYLLWDDGKAEDSIAGVASSLAGRPLTPSTDAYSMVNVHAWSSWSGAGAMSAVQQTVSKLPANVKVVTVEELFYLMTH